MNARFPDSNQLAKLFGVTRREFHREIKPFIVADSKSLLDEYNIANPDIGIDSKQTIYLRSSDQTTIIETDLTIQDYL
jgi:hypothetical protein